MRLRILFSSLKVMFFVSLPAVTMLWLCGWLLQMGLKGLIWPWVVLVLASPWTLLATLIALPVDFFLLLSLVGLLLGRPAVYVRYSSRAQTYRPMKDVYPIELPPPQA